MEQKKDNLRLIIGIGAISTLMTFAFVCGVFYGHFQTVLGFATYQNTQQENSTEYIYINKTCELEVLRAKQDLWAQYYEKGYLNYKEVVK